MKTLNLVILLKDMYKAYHAHAYKPGTTFLYSNGTPRFGKHANTKLKGMVHFGLQRMINKYLVNAFNEFFAADKEWVISEYKRVVGSALGKDIDTTHLEKLHDLQYLPLEVKSLPEGSFVPYGTPTFTIKNTVAGFHWLVNMLEDLYSCEYWPAATAATTALAYRKRFEQSEALTNNVPAMIPFLGHDFSFRGLPGVEASHMVGAGHLLSFCGSDTIPAALALEEYYGAKIGGENLVFASVDATEHSVMCSYGEEDELESLKRIITEVTPTGIVSIVSDTWDFWKLVTEYLPSIKDIIMSRDGTVVIRPDSGDPVKILTGLQVGTLRNDGQSTVGEVYKFGDMYFSGAVTYDEYGDVHLVGKKPVPEHEVKGLIECLWDTFGGTITPDGYKLLDSHIGAIYGDSITLERQDQIISRLEAKGFVPNVVLGIGSFTYQYVTRDTHGFAMKATARQDASAPGVWIPMAKDPKTDTSKKSAKGLMMVKSFNDKDYEVLQDVTSEMEARGALQVVFKDGKVYNQTTLEEIRKRISKYF